MANAKFTVDTHLFRELGELLVGRDSTALVELIKNAYDADATSVVVHGHDLNNMDKGVITITDDGLGMTAEEFELGFLRIASRLKETKDRKSKLYHRRYTGAKGIGRLAAHKLARFLEILSVPGGRNGDEQTPALVAASIDWEKIEAKQTLDELEGSDAIKVNHKPQTAEIETGTVINLKKLRRKWSELERARFFAEVQTYRPPEVLITPPKSILAHPLLFAVPKVADAQQTDPGFHIALTGDFAAGEEYWQNLSQTAQWVIEIDARSKPGKVRIQIAPTRKGLAEFPDAQLSSFRINHPNLPRGPFFNARILVREGAGGKREEKAWLGRTNGIRVYMEGFRVLPYGEPSDDWLSIDADYKRRQKTLSFLTEVGFDGKAEDEEEGLLFLGNSAYFGAVFLTSSGAPDLRMLVNREGFIPDTHFDALVKILRTAIYLSVRVRASAKATRRAERSEIRKKNAGAEKVDVSRLELRQAVEHSVRRAGVLAAEARQSASAGDFKKAQELISDAAQEFARGGLTSERLVTEGAILRVLASVGTQMTAFVHEIRGLLEIATAMERAVARLAEDDDLPRSTRQKLKQVDSGLAELRRSVERQAIYFTEVTSADARRRRSRLSFSERFESAKRFIENAARRREIQISNHIPEDLKSPPMFPAELTLVFTNLLTNAVKAAGEKGKIAANAKRSSDESVVLRIENTGRKVQLKQAERWFRPFESTTSDTDPQLGQGMGMGLPITRNMLEDYGASIRFVEPGSGYATAVEVVFPGDR
jgi:signal transduction histidine kinase